MKEKRIEVVKDWPKLQLVRDIQVFLGFANFYRRFIRNFSKIAALFTLIFWTKNKLTGDKTQSIQTENQDVLSATGRADTDGISGSIKNLSTIANLARSKKSKLKANFVKPHSETDLLTLRAKKAFIYLQKTFIKDTILRHFDPNCHI